MKRKLTYFGVTAMAILFLGFGYSCSRDGDYLSEFEVRKMIEDALRENNQNLEFTEWEIVPITVGANEWEWNSSLSQWEAVYTLPGLTNFIYEDGAVLGFVFLGSQNVDEVQKPLPYINTYYDEENDVTFTETISYDYQYSGNQSTVAFYIKDSALAEDSNAPVTYNFRIVMIW